MSKFKPYLIYALLGIFLVSAAIIIFHEKTNDEQPGPHGGKMLSKGNIAIEITMYEQGMPPHFRAYLYKRNKPLAPSLADLVVTLKRFNNETNIIQFIPIDGFLQSRETIHEPHSFDVTVSLKLADKEYRWNYENIEGRVTLSPQAIKSAGIKTNVVGAATIEKKLSVIGKIVPNADALLPIYPRFAGIVREMKKNLGDSVEKGETIAMVESNESLRNYPIISPIAGTIVQKNVIIGEMIKEDKAIYKVADLSTVWADLTLYRKEAPLIKKEMPVVVTGDNGKPTGTSVINYISPLGIEDSQTILARTALANVNQEWIPGMYVNAEITYLNKNVPVAIQVTALQRWRDWDVIFIQRGNTFEATPVTLGEKNGQWVEVMEGLKTGQTYVTENSFLLKADLGKSGASHED